MFVTFFQTKHSTVEKIFTTITKKTNARKRNKTGRPVEAKH